MKRLSTPVVITLACLSLFAAAAQAAIVNVGPGLDYATIQDAINAIPGSVTFTEPHIINVHAGIYAGFQTYQGGAANNKLPTADNRLIIQAVPGDEVVIAGQGFIRSNYVTVQGFKFQAPAPLGSGSYYLHLNYYSEGKGGAIIQNNEFVNGAPFWFRTVNNEAPEFSYAFVHNASIAPDNHVNFNASVVSTGKELVGGNLFYGMPGVGGNAISMRTPAGSEAKYFLNNTIGHNVPSSSVQILFRAYGADKSPLTIANNAIVITDNASTDRGYQFEETWANTTGVPSMYNNLQYHVPGTHRWAVVGADHYQTLDAFNAALIGQGYAPEANSLYGVDPMFKDLLGNDFRPQGTSPLQWGGDPTIWATAIADLGIAVELGSYWNPLRDYLYDRTGTYIGALIPEPTSLALLALAGLVGLRRPKASGAASVLPGSPA